MAIVSVPHLIISSETRSLIAVGRIDTAFLSSGSRWLYCDDSRISEAKAPDVVVGVFFHVIRLYETDQYVCCRENQRTCCTTSVSRRKRTYVVRVVGLLNVSTNYRISFGLSICSGACLAIPPYIHTSYIIHSGRGGIEQVYCFIS